MANKYCNVTTKKDEVLTQLPNKLFSVLPQEISNKADYNKAEDNFLDWLVEKEEMMPP